MLARTSLSDAVHFHTSESVTEGHPDKICDQIADAILDDILAVDPYGRVACEVVATTGLVFIFGEITTTRRVDYEGIARRTIREIGYTRPEYAFDADSCGIIVSVKEQSSDIASAVDVSLEVRRGQEEAEGLEIGAGDQGHMIGFACIETPTFMPLPIHLAHRLTRQLARARKEGILPFLRPDGKSQVTIEYTNGTARRIAAIVISAQHDPDVADEKLRQGILEQVIRPMIPANLLDEMTAVHINPSGRFVIGGPAGDSGLTGRKNIVDTYGSNARHGGGSYSGKDPTKVDRSGSYAARYVAKNIVAAGLADRLEVELAYAIGVAQPLSIAVETFGTEHVPKEMILKLIRQHFDLRPGAIIRDLALRRPIYRPTAAYGHFGRDDIDAPWEHTDRASAIRQAAGL
ncbi:MAG TPA: methionine adenosyltransferase [Dehalococcoidia bacterium]|nr:methionine adenosyltransferase [Dehalococcoidia bacterium]